MPISYGTPSDPDASVGACVVNRDWDVPDGTATDKDAVAVERALDEAVMIAVPDVVGMKLELATPRIGNTGKAGLNEPDTPLTEKVTGLVASGTTFPLTSKIVAAYAIEDAVCVVVAIGLNASLFG
jgi:hypothetical protein